MEASIGSFLSVAGFGLAGVLGVVAANYTASVVDPSTSHPWLTTVAGALLVAIPAFWLKNPSGFMGAARLILGVAGVTLMIRGLAAPGILNVQSMMPTPIRVVV